jgi:hypothetical protein
MHAHILYPAHIVRLFFFGRSSTKPLSSMKICPSTLRHLCRLSLSGLENVLLQRWQVTIRALRWVPRICFRSELGRILALQPSQRQFCGPKSLASDTPWCVARWLPTPNGAPEIRLPQLPPHWQTCVPCVGGSIEAFIVCVTSGRFVTSLPSFVLNIRGRRALQSNNSLGIEQDKLD